MRVLIVMLVTALIMGGISLAHKGLEPGAQGQEEKSLAPHEPTKVDSLPDSLRFASDVALRKRLIEGGLRELDAIRTKYANDMLLGINCDVAKARVLQDYGRATVSPLMLGASLMPRGGQQSVFAFHAINLGRETDRLLIVGRTRAGALFRVVYHFDIEWKAPSLVEQRMTLARKVSPDEIEKLGDVKRVASGREVHLPFRFGQLPIPDISPIAAAVEDRSGRTSNFVAVLEARGGPASGEETDKVQPVAEEKR
ncbi:MAG: hypothetical protein ACYC35_28245 [Pirellulales bacterium]